MAGRAIRYRGTLHMRLEVFEPLRAWLGQKMWMNGSSCRRRRWSMAMLRVLHLQRDCNRNRSRDRFTLSRRAQSM